VSLGADPAGSPVAELAVSGDAGGAIKATIPPTVIVLLVSTDMTLRQQERITAGDNNRQILIFNVELGGFRDWVAWRR
jgi:hypothetical protein